MIGQQAFAACMRLGAPPLLTIPLAAVASGIPAVSTAWMVFRLRGPHFAIGTWVVADVYRLTFAQMSALGGGSGMSPPAATVRTIASDARLRDGIVYGCAPPLTLVSLGVVSLLWRGRLGLGLTTVRDNEAAAGALGVETARLKFGVYVVRSMVTGAAGALIFLHKLRISPDAACSVNDWTALMIFMAVISGIGTSEGPVVGMLVFLALRGALAGLGPLLLMIPRAIAGGIMLVAPRGLRGMFAHRAGLPLFPVQRRLHLRDR